MTERYCLRGCVAFEVAEDGTRTPKHYAGCPDYGSTEPGSCCGCVLVECRDGSLVCDSCFGKARALLSDAPDLLARLRSEADAAKSGWNWDTGPVIRTTSVHAPAPVGDDLFDAIVAVEHAMWFYAAGMEALSNNEAAMSQLGPLILDQHAPDEDGVREAWSVLDVLKRWGLERRDTHRHVYPGRLPNAPLGSYAKYDEEEQGTPVGEWYDPILSVNQVAERTQVGERDVRRWITKGLIEPVARIREGSAVRTYLRASDADRVAAEWLRERVG